MSRLTKEVGEVEATDEGLLLIHHEQVFENGVTFAGEFVCERSAALWLAARMEEAIQLWSAPDIDEVMPPDHFLVFQRGGEHGEDVNVHVHNERGPNALRSGLYVMSGLSPALALSIVSQLRALAP